MTFFSVFIIQSCSPGQENKKIKGDNPQLLEIEFQNIQSADSMKNMKAYYTESNGQLFIVYYKDTLGLGNHRGTMGMPPGIQCIKQNDRIFFEITTNITQLGITFDNIYLYHMDTDSKVHNDCTFENISEHPLEQDSLSDNVYYKTYLDNSCFYLEQYQPYAAISLAMIPRDTVVQKCVIR